MREDGPPKVGSKQERSYIQKEPRLFLTGAISKKVKRLNSQKVIFFGSKKEVQTTILYTHSKVFRLLLRLMHSKTQPLLALGTLPGDIHQKLGANDKSELIR